jgi:zinc transport system permease protein
MFWWSLIIAVTSAVAGLMISAQGWAHTATGATVILCAAGWFVLSLIPLLWQKAQSR